MKRKGTIILLVAMVLSGTTMHAQDSAKKSAAKQIGNSSEKTDQLNGKKIQQQSLLNNKFEVLDSTKKVSPAKKKRRKSC